ncbi:IclR family transcriptional regulator [Methylobacterium sp. NEAU 140]|uniref:IclR family transcriptional regulator n=1 Tax=Methylobacterium sp. NEAU 140 TaxID=3064945 RepID=UPI00273650A9|nr:IclR family transcriptional regulator [Methylobacterium sp. NEAU 140]MDP4026482.1 IclR family transcriptional regulator [Methylobacterium sp. NEAU 140]
MSRTKAAPPASGAPAEVGQQVQGTAAFSKFMLVLQTVADAPGELDIARLAKLLPYPRGTLYRIVGALISEDMIRENSLTGTYQLGHRLMSLASKSWEAFDLRTVAHDHIAALRDATGETVHLAVPSGQEMVYIDKLESPRSVRMTSRIGTRVSLHSTSVGKAYLAALKPAERERLLGSIELVARTPYTITRSQDLRAEILETQRRSYSTDREENELEIRCFGAAILDRDGTPIGCVSVSIPKYRFNESESGTFVAELLSRVQAISRSLLSQL